MQVHHQLKEAAPEASPKGESVGFWLIPKGENQYMKLRIFRKYTFEEDQTLPNVQATWQSIKQGNVKNAVRGAMGDSTWDVEITMGGQLLPIWAVLANVDILSKHFQWIPAMLKNKTINNVYLPSLGEESVAAAEMVQSQLMKRGWSFAVKDGENVLFGCRGGAYHRPPYFDTFTQEISGSGPSMTPIDIKLGEPGEIKTVQFFDSSGEAGGRSMSLDYLMGKAKKDEPKSPDEPAKPAEPVKIDKSDFKSRVSDPAKEKDFAGWVNNLFASGQNISLVEFAPEYDGHKWWDMSNPPFDKIEPQVIRHYFEYERFTEAVEKKSVAPRVMALFSAVIGALAESKHRQLLEDMGWDDMAFHKFAALSGEDKKAEMQESKQPINEMTFRELLRQTSHNGGYRIGGMRRIHGRWLYDMSIPDRMTNSRFVIVRQPRLGLDTDGSPIYRFRFRSRADRNTTGMAQSGYVKFVQTKRGLFKKAIRFIANTELDEDVQVGCSCPDFRFKWHWVLARSGASHTPTGIGFDATDDPPNHTNPRHLVGICKHLCVFQDILSRSAREHDREVGTLRKDQQSAPTKPAKKSGEPPKIKAGAELDATRGKPVNTANKPPAAKETPKEQEEDPKKPDDEEDDDFPPPPLGIW